MFELLIDRSMYDHVGQTTTMQYEIRKYRDRPAIAAGTEIRILKYVAEDGRYTIESRVLIETLDGSVRRWVPTIKVTPIDAGNEKMFSKIGKIASNILNDRD
jgi:hypothetical protein